MTSQQIQWLVNCAAKHVALIRPSIHTGRVEQRAIKSQWWGKAPARKLQTGRPLWTTTQFCLRLSILPDSLFTRLGRLSTLGQVDSWVRLLLCMLRPPTWLVNQPWRALLWTLFYIIHQNIAKCTIYLAGCLLNLTMTHTPIKDCASYKSFQGENSNAISWIQRL